MAKLAMASETGDESVATRLKEWPQRVTGFYNDVRTEMKRVTTPSLKEVRATTTVVVITVFIFGLYFWIVDTLIGQGIDRVLRYFTHR